MPTTVRCVFALLAGCELADLPPIPKTPPTDFEVVSVQTSADVTLSGEFEFSRFATHIGPAGDVNGDGLADFYVSQNNFRLEDGLPGYFLFFGPATDATGPSDADAAVLDNPNALRGTIGDDPAAGFGDLSGDGVVDALIPSTSLDVLYVVRGPLVGPVSVASAATTIVTGQGTEARELSTAGVLGDLDGDGTQGLFFRDYPEDPSLPSFLSVWESPPGGLVSVEQADTRFEEDEWWSRSTGAVTTGDFDGDGQLDLVVATAHEVYFFYGPNLPENPELLEADSTLVTNADREARSSDANVLITVDLNQDGTDDLLVVGSELRGYLGPFSGLRTFESADLTLTGLPLGFEGAATVGDVDGDGQTDVLLPGGELEVDPTAPVAPGEEVFKFALVYGPLEGDMDVSDVAVLFTVNNQRLDTPYSAAIIGDTDGDGSDDVLFGGNQDGPYGEPSRAYLIRGRRW